jgi:serine protease AprX
MHGIVVWSRQRATAARLQTRSSTPRRTIRYVITVDGVDENGGGNPTGDTIASWSSQATTQGAVQKPDVYAPGAHIVSVLAPNSNFATSCASCVVGNGQYLQTSGTSMAAPMISGLVTDLLQIHPNWTPDEEKGDLTSSAVTENSSFQEPNAITAALRASFALSSWSCDSCSATSGAGAAPSLGSWSLGSWSTVQSGIAVQTRGGSATQRSRVTRPARNSLLRRSRIAGAIRSSSCAHTEAEQDTVTTPPRSAVGSASPAIAAPTAPRHAR